MDRRYKHLDSEERGVILAEHQRGASARSIRRLLNRSGSTISRELRRGAFDGTAAPAYCAQRAGAGYRERRNRCGRRRKLVEGDWLHGWVRDRLIHFRWSPEQISAKLKLMNPDDPSRRISHETIFTPRSMCIPELVWRRSWETRRQAEMAIFEYINGFYNPRRRHSALGWKSPVAFERKVA